MPVPDPVLEGAGHLRHRGAGAQEAWRQRAAVGLPLRRGDAGRLTRWLWWPRGPFDDSPSSDGPRAVHRFLPTVSVTLATGSDIFVTPRGQLLLMLVKKVEKAVAGKTSTPPSGFLESRTAVRSGWTASSTQSPPSPLL